MAVRRLTGCSALTRSNHFSCKRHSPQSGSDPVAHSKRLLQSSAYIALTVLTAVVCALYLASVAGAGSNRQRRPRRDRLGRGSTRDRQRPRDARTVLEAGYVCQHDGPGQLHGWGPGQRRRRTSWRRWPPRLSAVGRWDSVTAVSMKPGAAHQRAQVRVLSPSGTGRGDWMHALSGV